MVQERITPRRLTEAMRENLLIPVVEMAPKADSPLPSS
jgi:hypothetical protein